MASDIRLVCEVLTGSGVVLTGYFFEPGEPCAHHPGDALRIVVHVDTLSPDRLHSFGASIGRLERSGCSLWSTVGDCPLCAFLHALARRAV